MPVAPRPCLDCGRITRNGSRCRTCEAVRTKARLARVAAEYGRNERGTSTERGYNSEWYRMVKLVKARDGYTCQICGHRGSRDNPLTGDHITPRSKGGLNTLDNMQCLCRSCNSAKRDRG